MTDGDGAVRAATMAIHTAKFDFFGGLLGYDVE
jgi:hypothetical protein